MNELEIKKLIRQQRAFFYKGQDSSCKNADPHAEKASLLYPEISGGNSQHSEA